MVRLFGGSVWETGSGTGHARPFRAEHMPMGHNRTTNRRTNAKKETTEDGPKRGWARPPAGGRETGRAAPSTASAYPTLWGLFRKERSRERGRCSAGRRAERASELGANMYARLLCKLFGPAIFLTPPSVTDNLRITCDLRLTVLAIRRVEAREICGSLRRSNMQAFQGQ